MPSALNLSWITPRLAVGGSFSLSAVASLAELHAVRAVVDLRSEACDDEGALRRAGIAFLHLPTEDQCAVSLERLDQGVAFAIEHLHRSERVLLHCEHGIGRSVLLALCVLTAEGMDPLEALRLVKVRREVCSPNPVQYEAWVQWLRRHKAASASPWSPPDFESFSAVAYRHLTSGG